MSCSDSGDLDLKSSSGLAYFLPLLPRIGRFDRFIFLLQPPRRFPLFTSPFHNFKPRILDSHARTIQHPLLRCADHFKVTSSNGMMHAAARVAKALASPPRHSLSSFPIFDKGKISRCSKLTIPRFSGTSSLQGNNVGGPTTQSKQAVNVAQLQAARWISRLPT